MEIKDRLSAGAEGHAYDTQMLPAQCNEMKVCGSCRWALACQQNADCQVQCSTRLSAQCFLSSFSLIILGYAPSVSTVSMILELCLRSCLNEQRAYMFLALTAPIKSFNAEHMGIAVFGCVCRMLLRSTWPNYLSGSMSLVLHK